jgi:transposase-like protein
MEEIVTVQCPYCGQDCLVELDAALSRQQFTTDCEVCCRPFSVQVECELGEVVRVCATGE